MPRFTKGAGMGELAGATADHRPLGTELKGTRAADLLNCRVVSA